MINMKMKKKTSIDQRTSVRVRSARIMGAPDGGGLATGGFCRSSEPLHGPVVLIRRG
jgi:hypothetical protein